MKRKLTAIVMVMGLLLTTWGASAQEQKVGYVNTDSVFASLPETKIQQKKLESYGKQIQTRLKQKQQQFQQKYQNAVQQAEAGALTAEQQGAIQQELQQMQQDLQKEQAAAQVNMTSKENELLQPLYLKMQKAIKTVAQKNGFTYIMAENMLVFGADALDVTDMVVQEIKSMQE